MDKGEPMVVVEVPPSTTQPKEASPLSTIYTDTARDLLQTRIYDSFAGHVRDLVQRLINQFLLYEQDAFLACEPYERTSARRGYRNGTEARRFDTVWGPLTVRMPRVAGTPESFRPLALGLYQRRQREVDQAIADVLARGLSTRECARAIHRCFGSIVSAATVSNVVAQLDERVCAFHRRDLDRGYRYLHLDARHTYVSHRRTRRGRGKKKKAAVLLAWGVRHDGVRELVDHRVADSESYESWMRFATDLEARGVRARDSNERPLQMIVTDGDMGLLGAIETVWPTVPKQRCIFHKVQNVADHIVDRSLREAMLSGAGAIYVRLLSRAQARLRLRRWSKRWAAVEPAAVRNFQMEFERTLTYLSAPAHQRPRLKTNNPIERFIEELNRKISQIGIFVNAASLDRTTYMVWDKLQANGYPGTEPDPQTLFPRNY